MLKRIAGWVAGAVLFASGAHAETCAPHPNTLQNSTTADANQVMQNFDAIRNCVNNNVVAVSGGTLLNPILSGIVYGGASASNTLQFESTSGNSNRAGISIGNIIGSDNGGISLSVAGPTVETVAMRIQGTSGNVGIGTTNPGYLLQVGSTAAAGNRAVVQGLPLNQASESVTSGIRIGAETWANVFDTQNYAWEIDRTNIANDFNGRFSIINYKRSGSGTATSEVMSIINTGNVGISTASPGYKLHVNGSVAGTSAYNNLSDARLKKNITPISNALALVERLRGVRFLWKNLSERSVGAALDLPATKSQVGFIAQEVASVVPEAVSVADGKDAIMSIQESKIVPLLVEAVKELKIANDRLIRENVELRSQIGGDHKVLESYGRRITDLESRYRISQRSQ